MSEDINVFVITSNRRTFFFPENEKLNFDDVTENCLQIEDVLKSESMIWSDMILFSKELSYKHFYITFRRLYGGIYTLDYSFAITITGPCARVSVQGVESLWGDCRFIPADWGSQ